MIAITRTFSKIAHKGSRTSIRTSAKAENQVISAQYAQALLDVAQASSDLESVHSDIDSLHAIMQENASLCSVMANPLVSPDKKIALIQKISSEGSFNKTTTNFLNLLVDKGRVDCIAEIVEAFEDIYCLATDTRVATVSSAVTLDEEQQFLIAKKVQELTQSKSVKIKPVVDEALIGGFVVEYGSSKIDLSVRGAFERVKKELSNLKQ